MDACNINEIFKRFYRAENVRKIEGIGVGLYLTREIILKQGGYIKVSSSIGEQALLKSYNSSIEVTAAYWYN